MSSESRWKRCRWMQKDVGSVSPEQSPQGKRKPGGRSLQCGWMQALRWPCLPRRERISTRHPALEAVITFLQKSGRPRQMTSSSRSTMGGWGVRSGFPLPTPSTPVVPGDYAARLPAPSPRQQRVGCILHSFRMVSVFFDICEHSSEEHVHRVAGRPRSHDHWFDTWEAAPLAPNS